MVQMRAVVYDGPFKVSIQNVEKPEIQHPNDVIVKSTLSLVSYPIIRLTWSPLPSHDLLHLWQVEYLISHVLPLLTAIKLSDLHMYEGRTAAEAGIVDIASILGAPTVTVVRSTL